LKLTFSRILRDARAAEKAGYLKPGDQSRIGSSQAFSNNYGFNYTIREKEDAAGDAGE